MRRRDLGRDALIDGPTLALWFGLPPSTLRWWAHTGQLQAQGYDRQRRALYRYRDVAILAATRRQPGAGLD